METQVMLCAGRRSYTLLGFSGPRSEAEEIKRRIRTFLRDELRLELSAEKTLITHARTRAARFLGFEVVALAADHKHDRRGQRCINGAVRLKVPKDVIVAQCRPYMRTGKAAYGGFVQYYRLAMNAHCLRRVYRVMQTKSIFSVVREDDSVCAHELRRMTEKMS